MYTLPILISSVYLRRSTLFLLPIPSPGLCLPASAQSSAPISMPSIVTTHLTHLGHRAETSMIKAFVARSINASIVKTSQQALQADRVTPLTLFLKVTNASPFYALVVEDLEVDV